MFILLIVFVLSYYKVLSLFVHFITKTTTSFEFCRKVNYICQLNMEISHDDDSLIVKFSIN